jgi:hypothetical protein
LNYGKPQKFFKQQLLPQQLHCNHSKALEKLDIAKPKKINKPIVLQLGISVCKRMWLLGMF